jgi:hypothetical protein
MARRRSNGKELARSHSWNTTLVQLFNKHQKSSEVSTKSNYPELYDTIFRTEVLIESHALL